MENRIFLEKSWDLGFSTLSWKSHGIFKNHHGKLKNTQLLLGCGILVFPKLAQNLGPTECSGLAPS